MIILVSKKFALSSLKGRAPVPLSVFPKEAVESQDSASGTSQTQSVCFASRQYHMTNIIDMGIQKASQSELAAGDVTTKLCRCMSFLL